ncbi:fatty-acyl-CoA synthase [Venturia nashicola]|uniref:Fatty-acyl-CoA synthase n=1 Tax=Venturia nashicola TaxID=86259 RepID=A0A4Z1PGN2_9PEZI|nr:fatty-acyl-CoA synthase [Venturia nashicola]
MAPENWDRTHFTPQHSGRNVLPCMPLFTRLLRLAHRKPPTIAIRDVRASTERTYLELLTDVLTFRERILDMLSPQTLEAIRKGEEIYIAVLAPGGYEFTVGVLAVLATGAAVVPMTTVLPVEEASYFVNKSQAVAVLAAESALNLGMGLQRHINLSTNKDFKCVPIKPSIGAEPLSSADIYISSDRYTDDNAPGVVIFTSGTTGPPKGAVMRRAFTHDCALQVAEHYGIEQGHTLLHCLPVHHATGIGIMFFPLLMAGATIEFRSGGFDEVWMWERWREGVLNPQRRLTFFSGVPTIYMRMRRHYQQVLSKLAPERVNEYILGARQFRAVLCGTSALPHPIAEFWTELMQERIMQRYGGTEFGAIFKVQMGATDVPDGSVGQRVPGYDVKLSNGDEGEVLVRNAHMFAKYLRDPEATAKAHNAEGYFKTGDIARREGNHHFIIGRASQDIIKSGGYKLSALDIERELLALPYIAEAIVVGVQDEEFGQRVGAILTLHPEAFGGPDSGEALTIEVLRKDLRARLARYKMPTLLRVVEGELPKTASGKILKKVLGEKYFPQGYERISEVQIWRVTVKREERARL